MSSRRDEIEQLRYLLCNLWQDAIPHCCDCKTECKSVREVHDGHWPVWGCTRGKLTAAVNLIQPHLPDEWPDEWDDEWSEAIKAAIEAGAGLHD